MKYFILFVPIIYSPLVWSADLPDYTGIWERNVEKTLESARGNPEIPEWILKEIANNWGLPETRLVYTDDTVLIEFVTGKMENIGPMKFKIIESSKTYLKVNVDTNINNSNYMLESYFEGNCSYGYNDAWKFRTYYCRTENP